MPSLTSHCGTELQPPLAKSVYFNLCDGQAELTEAASFLSEQLARAAPLASDLPPAMQGLESWMQAGVEKTGRQYRDYLGARQAGSGRRYFSNKSHALYFLKCVSPTK